MNACVYTLALVSAVAVCAPCCPAATLNYQVPTTISTGTVTPAMFAVISTETENPTSQFPIS
jgi:hypothetical protein